MARSEALLRIHRSLVARRAELRKRLGMELEDLGHVRHSSATGDAADAAFESTGEELASQLAELEAREVHQIERALFRLKQGTYGLCEACATKIPVMRLNALPYSTLCIICQRQAERDSSWLESRRGSVDWTKVSDGGEDREVDLSDIELDISK